ncbi:ribose-phosphate pyrophosphokinase [Mesorhizobium sp. VK24D]|uniref:Ribose-phosphate pyrophosphokinase n=1 Tax=Mesorhizobium album TaxID=3072314 RepID=A0ABU4XVM8_9HYPH|nr:ribose-phosphate pyrophosphokinase [Mesorhizobium sp. VK24D]MDX8477935.1 ribose-phosphate pyrophosphokinase [Mesorhizobium sp. VK24D]
MTRPLLFALPGNEALTRSLASRIEGEMGVLEVRSFPDEETYLRLGTDIKNRSVILVCTLDRPDAKFLKLAYAAATARELGAQRVGLVAPYLAYMRQDKRFHPGEAVTSVAFARLLSAEIDWLATVDPHLHRHPSLGAIYPIPTETAHAAPLLAAWIRSNVERPLLIGPDIESEQWVAAVAGMVGAPYRVLRKERRGDRDVRISVPDLHLFSDRVPVLIDDIVSSGRTMMETARHLREQHLPPVVCVAVHALLSTESYRSLKDIASAVVTTNAVPHPSNAIDLTPIIADAVGKLI